MNTYKTSTGERVTQSEIDAKTKEAKRKALQKQFDENGYNFCEDCKRNINGNRLDCSHEIPMDKAKKNGQTEKCWDVNNIIIRCRSCHEKKDGLNLQFKKL